MSSKPDAGHDGYAQAKTKEELGAKLLESVGLSPDMITAPAIQAAIEANDVLVSRLEQIAQDAGHQEE